MYRICAITLFFLLASVPAFAQVNPFAGDEEETEKKTEPKKKKTVKKIKKIKKISKKKSDDDDEEEEEKKPVKKETKPDPSKAAASTKKDEDEEDDDFDEDEDDDEEDDDFDEDEEEEVAEDDDKKDVEEKPVVEAKKEKPKTVLPPIPRVPLSANYNSVELITTGTVLAAGLTLSIAGTKLIGAPKASMRQPQLGSIDYDFSINNHGDLETGDPFLFGTLDIAAVALPLGAGLYYLISGGYYWAADKPLLKSQSVNIDHSMIGYANAIGWTALIAGVTKLLVGRERPYSAFNRDAFAPDDEDENNASFFSSTAAIGYAFAAFVGRDFSDWLVHRKMVDASPAKKFWLGRVVPTATLYSLITLTAYSSIRNQRHYLSDVGVGAMVGTLFGNLVYSSHFDTKGRPRIRHEQAISVSAAPTVMATPDGTAVVGSTISGSW